MKNFLTAFFVFLVWSAFALWFHNRTIGSTIGYDATSKIKENSNVKTTAVQPEKTIDSVASVKDTTNFAQKEQNTSNFTTKEHVITSPVQFNNLFITNGKNGKVYIPSGMNRFKYKIFDFLNKNLQKELIIRSKYLPNEIDSSTMNFGIRRGEFLKELLVDYGINPSKIVVESEKSDYNYNKNGYYVNGISFFYADISEQKMKTIEKGIANKTLFSYFARKNFKEDRAIYTYALELKDYLQKYPSKKVVIIGHTDTVGEKEANKWMGMERAKNAQAFFVNQGIDKTKITTQSKGDTVPIADNTTKEGRAKNRRIEINIK